MRGSVPEGSVLGLSTLLFRAAALRAGVAELHLCREHLRTGPAHLQPRDQRTPATAIHQIKQKIYILHTHRAKPNLVSQQTEPQRILLSNASEMAM